MGKLRCVLRLTSQLSRVNITRALNSTKVEALCSEGVLGATLVPLGPAVSCQMRNVPPLVLYHPNGRPHLAMISMWLRNVPETLVVRG